MQTHLNSVKLASWVVAPTLLFAMLTATAVHADSPLDDLKEVFRKAGEGLKRKSAEDPRSQPGDTSEVPGNNASPSRTQPTVDNSPTAGTSSSHEDDDLFDGQSSSQPMVRLARGDVRRLQQCLNTVGGPLAFDAGVPDGIAGEKTFAAVRIFIEAYELPSDGTLNEQLLNDVCEAAKEVHASGQLKYPPVGKQSTVSQNPSPQNQRDNQAASIERKANSGDSLRDAQSQAKKPVTVSNTPPDTPSESHVRIASILDNGHTPSGAKEETRSQWETPYNLYRLDQDTLHDGTGAATSPESLLRFIGKYGEQRIDRCIAQALERGPPYELPYATGRAFRPFMDDVILGEIVDGVWSKPDLPLPAEDAVPPLLHANEKTEFAFLMEPGEKIFAMADGRVDSVTQARDRYPSWVHVRQDDGVQISYGAIDLSTLTVKPGDPIAQGELFGQLPVDIADWQPQLRIGVDRPVPCIVFRTDSGFAEPLRRGHSYARPGAETKISRAEDLARFCDLQAESANDPDRRSDGIEIDAIDVAIAYPMCRDAIKHNPANPKLMYQLSRVFLAQDDTETAKLWLHSAIDRGSFVAAFEFGELQEKQDPVDAMRLYRRAAQDCHRGAMRKLHAMYQSANGVPPHPDNLLVANAWLEKSTSVDHSNEHLEAIPAPGLVITAPRYLDAYFSDIDFGRIAIIAEPAIRESRPSQTEFWSTKELDQIARIRCG